MASPDQRTKSYPNGAVLEIVQGDITHETVGAIVNAANRYLDHGGGVAGMIARRGGPAIQNESNAWVRQHGPVTHEQPAFTTAGELPSRYVIHAVGPVWEVEDEDRAGLDAKLAAAVHGSLRLAEGLELDSLAMPAISTGIFGFPKGRAARVILQAIDDFFTSEKPASLKRARVVLFDAETLQAFLDEFDRGQSSP
ncbi:MAG: macro domain-containing protein [Chloroflexi bacterium]|nr:MAG: macro domain-containing protein [Chloroflexota bacterium]